VRLRRLDAARVAVEVSLDIRVYVCYTKNMSRTHKHYCANGCGELLGHCAAPADVDGTPNTCTDEAFWRSSWCDDCEATKCDTCGSAPCEDVIACARERIESAAYDAAATAVFLTPEQRAALVAKFNAVYPPAADLMAARLRELFAAKDDDKENAWLEANENSWLC